MEEYIEILLLYIEYLDSMIVFLFFLSLTLVVQIFYLVYQAKQKRKENLIRRAILRKKFGIIIDDIMEDHIY